LINPKDQCKYQVNSKWFAVKSSGVSNDCSTSFMRPYVAICMGCVEFSLV